MEWTKVNCLQILDWFYSSHDVCCHFHCDFHTPYVKYTRVHVASQNHSSYPYLDATSLSQMITKTESLSSLTNWFVACHLVPHSTTNCRPGPKRDSHEEIRKGIGFTYLSTYWGDAHTYINELGIHLCGNGLPPNRHQAINWLRVHLLSIGQLGTILRAIVKKT